MHLFDRISALFCFFLGLAVLAKGLRLGLRVQVDMGPGFFPLAAGGILAFLSVILFTQSLLKKEAAHERISFWANSYGWKLVLLTLLSVSAYPFILNHAGFLLSTFLLMVFLFGVIARRKWWTATAGGIVTAAAVYWIFRIWLKADLPLGILSF
jgi:putative tricarboxylic transport membrane protein